MPSAGTSGRNAVNATEIFANLPQSQAEAVLRHLHENDKNAYKACIHLLAGRRKLRTIVVERRTRAEQHEWLRAELARKANGDAAIEVLQAWLLGAHRDLVCEFLDTLKIPHDGQGLIDTLPPQPPDEDIRSAVDKLFANHDHGAVTVYLHLFAEMDIADWPFLAQLLQEDSRLCLAPQTNPA